jgi:hypothetical protein
LRAEKFQFRSKNGQNDRYPRRGASEESLPADQVFQ